jgi:hypothetical protein
MIATFMRTSLAKSPLRAQLLCSKPTSLAALPFAIVLQRARRSLANVRDSPKQGSNVWFAGSTAPFQVSNSGPGSGRDHKPPDERTLKLGKSELESLRQSISIPNTWYSHTNSPRPTTYASGHSAPPRNPISSDHPPSLSLNSSSLTHR